MPVIQASSKPPNLLMTSIPSLGSGLFTFKACFTTSILMASRSSEILVPLPVHVILVERSLEPWVFIHFL